MQYLINIDGFVVRSPLLLLATPLKSCTMESEILLQFHSILPKVVYFRMELHPIVQRRPRVAMVLVAWWWCHSGSARRWRPRPTPRPRRGGSGISFDTNIVVRCNTKPSCLALSSSKERAAALLWASKQCQWRPLALRLLLLLFRLNPPNNQPLCSYDFDSNHTNGQQQWKDIFVSSSNPSFKEGSSPFAVLAADSRRRRGWSAPAAMAAADAVEERHCWELTRNNSITSRCNSQSTIYFFPSFSRPIFLYHSLHRDFLISKSLH